MIGPNSNPLIQKFEHLYPLTPEEQAALAGAFSRILVFGENEDLVREGDKPSESNVLLEGMTIRYHLLPDGRRQIFSFHVPGDIYDAQSFLLDTMDHSVATITPCKIAVISHAAMKELTEDHPRIGRAIWKETLADAAVFRQRMVSLGRRSSYQRIAHLICEMYVKNQAIARTNNGEIDWPITQSEMGDALGLSLVHVNRTVQALRAEKLITLSKNTLVIRDWEGLKAAAEFDPLYLHLTPREPGRSGNGKPAWIAHERNP